MGMRELRGVCVGLYFAFVLCGREFLGNKKGSTLLVGPFLLLTVIIKIFCHLGTQNNKRILLPWREQSAQALLW